MRGTALQSRVQFIHFADPVVLLAADASAWDYVISDVDLERPDTDGYAVVEQLLAKKDVFKGACCIHSNKALTHDFILAQKAGAKAFQPKPMALEHLLKFVLDNPPPARDSVVEPLARVNGKPVVGDAMMNPSSTNPLMPAKPLIAFLDDDEFLRHCMEAQQDDAKVMTFASPEAFLDHVSQPLRLSAFTAIISDHFFGEASKVVGTDFAMFLRSRGYNGLLLLYSDGVFDEDEQEAFDGMLKKSEIPTWMKIREVIDASSPAWKRALYKTHNVTRLEPDDQPNQDVKAFFDGIAEAHAKLAGGQMNPQDARVVLGDKLLAAAEFLDEERIVSYAAVVEDGDLADRQLVEWQKEEYRCWRNQVVAGPERTA